MLDGAKLPQKGSTVQLERGHLAVAGTVMWEAGEVRGIRFDTDIDVDEWVNRGAHAGQRRVDNAIAAIRLGVRSVPPQINENPRRTLKDLGEELREVCEQIATSPDISVELGERLLKIETIAVELIRLDAG